MRYGGHLFLRVEPALPVAVAAAARAEGIGRSEFIRRAVRQALPADLLGDRTPEPPRPAGPASAMPAAA